MRVMALSSLFESMAICLFESVLNRWWFGIWVVVVLGDWYLLVFCFCFFVFLFSFPALLVVSALLGVCDGGVVVAVRAAVVVGGCCCGSGDVPLLLMVMRGSR